MEGLTLCLQEGIAGVYASERGVLFHKFDITDLAHWLDRFSEKFIHKSTQANAASIQQHQETAPHKWTEQEKKDRNAIIDEMLAKSDPKLNKRL